ncbi:ankyrin repeat domain-containing protein [Streptomyces globisporus]|uniref:ankyrin repeat domain-containing protein n=1 Tax=Streptomyces globisporus TaxID=1908 RepID=UPI002D21EE04|nr:ankyrin repeat domain-containing protein [Streptomyces globisporus]
MADGWAGTGWDWTDHDEIRRRLDEGADPESCDGGRPLHRAALFGSPEVVAELAGRVADVDALEDGVTALWEAVVGRKPENARALAAAGADPWRPSIGGWSPGRLSLAGEAPDLFPVPAGVRLTVAERAAAQEAGRLVAALGEFRYDGTGLACVAGIDAAEAVRRLEAVPAEGEIIDQLLEAPCEYDMDESLRFIGVTSVPGGCVVTQPWGYAPQMPGGWPGCPPGPSATACTPIRRAATRAASPVTEALRAGTCTRAADRTRTPPPRKY